MSIKQNIQHWTEGKTAGKTLKKVGTLIRNTEDVQRRKQLSTAALAKLQNVLVRCDKLKKKTKLKLYSALVKPVLTYNCSMWALT